MTRADSCQQCGRGICVGCHFVRRTRTGKRVHSSAEYNRGWRAVEVFE